MKNDIRKAYNLWSRSYDQQDNMTRDLDAAVLPKIVPDLSGLRVIEAGCGTGKNSPWLAERCKTLVALDFSEGMMSLARQKVTAENVSWARCDLNQLWPLADETADLVLFNLVLEHIERLEPLFAQAARVLRSGGAMIFSEYHPDRLADGGLGARITDESGEIVALVGSFRHEVDSFVRGGMSAGLELVEKREWQPDGEERPLLLSMRFGKK